MLNIFFIIYSNIDQAELKMTDKKYLDFIKNNYNTKIITIQWNKK